MKNMILLQGRILDLCVNLFVLGGLLKRCIWRDDVVLLSHLVSLPALQGGGEGRKSVSARGQQSSNQTALG